MIKKVFMILGAIFLVLGALFVYGVYRFLNPFGDLVDEDRSNSYYYSRKGDKIIYSPMGNWFELGKTEMDVDMRSFEVLARDYSKDKNNAYYKYALINIPVDVSSFRVHKNYVPMDKDHVYILLDGYYFFDDSKKGFKILEGADPKTYEHINYKFARDKNHFYKNDTIYTKVDRASFTILNQSFCKDINGVYEYSHLDDLEPLLDMIPEEVVVLNDTHIRDQSFVYAFYDYLGGKQEFRDIAKLPFNDSKSITFFEYDVLRIDDKIYYKGLELSEIDAMTYQDIKYGYARDANHIYYLGKIVENADLDSFRYIERDYKFVDKNHTYEMGKAVQ